MTIPKLPDGWYIINLYQRFCGDVYLCVIGHIKPYLAIQAQAETPREAVIAAIAKIPQPPKETK